MLNKIFSLQNRRFNMYILNSDSSYISIHLVRPQKTSSDVSLKLSFDILKAPSSCLNEDLNTLILELITRVILIRLLYHVSIFDDDETYIRTVDSIQLGHVAVVVHFENQELVGISYIPMSNALFYKEIYLHISNALFKK